LKHVREDREIFLRTDASEEGCGGYMFQKGDDGVTEEVVQYVSRSFNSTEQRWSTIEQEAFGVYFCVIRLEHLLLGRKFIIETDHANLIYINIAKAPKVVRWRLRLQEFDFEIRHIAGKLNVVADGLSRLLAMRVATTNVRAGRLPYRPKALGAHLPKGWREEINVQAAGKGAGKSTKIYYDSDGRKFGSADACWKEMFRLGLHTPALVSSPVADRPDDASTVDAGETLDDEFDFDISTEAGRLAALHHVHCDTNGHMRTVETTRRLRDAGLQWPGYAAAARTFISSCPTCQKTDVNRQVPARAQRAWSPPVRPGQILAVDLIGPVGDSQPPSKGEKRIKHYVLVMVGFHTPCRARVPRVKAG
jgi:hypothetical protein